MCLSRVSQRMRSRWTLKERSGTLHFPESDARFYVAVSDAAGDERADTQFARQSTVSVVTITSPRQYHLNVSLVSIIH